MLVLAAIVIAFALLAPYWLPRRVVALRSWIFARVNGEEGLMLPSATLDVAETLRIYRHPNAGGRSKGATLSDLFWYWMSPGAHLHQENVESGEVYEIVRATTRRLLGVRPATLIALATKHFERHCVGPATVRSVRATRWLMPAFAAMYYELIFGQEADDATVALLTAHAADFLGALKCNHLRDMDLRERARAVLQGVLATGGAARVMPLSSVYGDREAAEYLLTNFFSTGVVQISEAVAHALLALAHHRDVQATLVKGGFASDHLGAVLKEVLRVYPLFGVSHRILTGDVELTDGGVLRAGTVICLDHVAYNKLAYEDGERFDPRRWQDRELQKQSIAFGVRENRACPAEGFAMTLLSALLPKILARFEVRSTAAHTRSMPAFAPCLLVRREAPYPAVPLRVPAALGLMRLVDHWETLVLPLRQLVFGTAMVLEARKLRLCQRHFERGEHRLPVVGDGIPTVRPPQGGCPFASRLGPVS